MSAHSPESGQPLPHDPQLSSMDQVMSRRRFLGKVVMGVGVTTTLGGVGTAFWEGRKTHVDSDFTGVTEEEAQAMKAYDRRQWSRALNRIVVAGIGAVGAVVGGGVVLYNSESENTPHEVQTENNTTSEITIFSSNMF